MQFVVHSEEASPLRGAAAVAMARPSPGRLVQKSDDEIAARFAAGDSAAFAELMERHMGTVFGVAYGVLRDRDEAADVAQDVFLKLAQTLAGMRVHGSLGPWLYRVAMNRAIDRLRQTRRQRTISDAEEQTLSSPGPEPGAVMESIELRTVVFRAIARLPEKQRMVFTMRHVSGLSVEEIAAAMHCATGTVKCHLARATRKLRETLEPYLSEARREV